MPFDDVGIFRSPLAQLVLKPLSEAQVSDHKRMVVDAFCMRSSASAYLYNIGSARWETDPLLHVDQLVTFYAPKSVLKLAKRIETEIPDASMQVQWFYRDPILSVKHHGEVMHLAIWDRQLTIRGVRGKLIAMAEIARPPSRMMSLLRSWWV